MDRREIISNNPPRLSDDKDRLIDFIIKYSIPVRGNIYKIPEALEGFSKKELYHAIYDNCVFVKGPSIDDNDVYNDDRENTEIFYSVKYVGDAPFVFVGKGVNAIFVRNKEIFVKKEKENLLSDLMKNKDFVIRVVKREIDPIIEYARQREERMLFGDYNNENEEELW